MHKKHSVLVNHCPLICHQSVILSYITGLANRLVPQGQALNEAKLLAQQLLSFPQFCLCQDLRSTRNSAFSGLTLQERLRLEFERGSEVVKRESIQGAQRFSSGEGRGGEFD